MPTRRQFIERLALAGGFGAAYTAMRALGLTQDAAYAAERLSLPTAPPGTRVLILGAGISGLTAAWELTQAGYDVRMIEARDRTGGRNWSIRSGTKIDMTDGTEQVCRFSEGEYFNAGPARLPSHHQTVLGYCKQFGVALETEVNRSHSALMQNDAINAGKPFRVGQMIADTRGHVSELLGKAIHRGRLDDQLSAEDQDRLIAFLKLWGDLNSNWEYKGSSRAGYRLRPGAFDHPGVALDPLPLHELMAASPLWIGIVFDELIDWQATMMQPVGGMDLIPRAFTARLGDRIRQNTEVVGISQTPEGVRTVLRDRTTKEQSTEDADYVICTLPLNILSDMDTDFPPEVKAVLRRVAYDESLKVAFEAPRFWEDAEIYGGISYVSQDTSVVWYPSHGFMAPTGVFLGAYASSKPAFRLAKLPLEARIEAARVAVETLHPGKSKLLKNGLNVTWSKIPFNLGPWVREWGAVGGNDPADRAFLNQPIGRVYLAGANLSQMPGWQEGAMQSAWRVASLIGQRAVQTRKI